MLTDPSAQTLSIPDEYALNTIPYLAVAEMLYNRGEPDQAKELNMFGFANALEMYAYYQTQQRELQFGFRVRTASD